MAQHFGAAAQGVDTAQLQAVASVANMVRRNAYVMAYSDCFFVIGVALLLSLIPTYFLARPAPGSFGGH